MQKKFYLSRAGQYSDSEAEDDPASKVTLPQSLPGRGSKAGSKSAVRLMELGPRMRLQLMKIEEGLVDGEVLYHQFIQKTEEEKKIIRQRRETQRYYLKGSSIHHFLKLPFINLFFFRKNNEKVRKIQDAQRKRKEDEKEKHKEKSMEGMRRKQARSNFAENEENEDDEEDDDAEYYRSEVGQEPEKGGIGTTSFHL